MEPDTAEPFTLIVEFLECLMAGIRSLNRGRNAALRRFSYKDKKRGVPWHHVTMPAGNSFPQICVVSESYCRRIPST